MRKGAARPKSRSPSPRAPRDARTSSKRVAESVGFGQRTRHFEILNLTSDLRGAPGRIETRDTPKSAATGDER